MKNDYVSIILPTHNRAHCIIESIDSVLNQTYPYFELLVIDDGSTDNTEDVVKSINDDRIKYYKTPQNRGAAAARNYGISFAQYNLFAFQDSDDIWDPDKLTKEVACINADESLGMVYCQMRCIRVGADELKDVIYTPGDAVPKENRSGNIYEYLLLANYIGAPTMLIRKECLDKVGVFDESYSALEDWELILRISKEYIIGYVNEPLFTYNMQSSESVSCNPAAFFEARCKMLGTYRNDMIKYGVINTVMEDILTRANSFGLMERVAKIMEMYLQLE